MYSLNASNSLMFRVFRMLSILLWLLIPIAGWTAPAESQQNAVTHGELADQKELFQVQLEGNKALLEKDIGAWNQRLDDQSKQIDGIQSSIERFGIILSTLLVLAGIFGYFSVVSKAKNEAQAASENWFSAKAQSLLSEIEELRIVASQAHVIIEEQVKSVQHKADEAKDHIQVEISKPGDISSHSSLSVNDVNAQALQQQAKILQDRPESSYSFDDWNTRAFAAYSADRKDEAVLFWGNAADVVGTEIEKTVQALFNKGVTLGKLKRDEEALAAFEHIIALDGEDTSPALRELFAQAMFNIGVALGNLKRDEKAIAAYERVIKLYAEDSKPVLREYVAKAMCNKGVKLEKLIRNEEALVVYDRVIALYAEDTAPTLQDSVARAKHGKGMVLLCQAKALWSDSEKAIGLLQQALLLLQFAYEKIPKLGTIQGNLAYVHWLLGEKEQAETLFRFAFAAQEDGGETLHNNMLYNFSIYPIAPDIEARSLLERLWAEYQEGKVK